MPSGVSWITQCLYAVVFCSRYTDIFSETSRWNFFFKVFYIFSSIYIIAIMRWIYPRTREREVAWKLGAAALVGSLLLAPFVMLIFEGKDYWSFFTVRLISCPHPADAWLTFSSGFGISLKSSNLSACCPSFSSSDKRTFPPSSIPSTLSRWPRTVLYTV